MMGQTMKASGSGENEYVAKGVISICSRIRDRAMAAASSVPAKAPSIEESPGRMTSLLLRSTRPDASTAKRWRYPSDWVTAFMLMGSGTGPSIQRSQAM